MVSGDGNDMSTSNDPLLSTAYTTQRDSNDLNVNDTSADPERQYSGGWFVWVLSFSAGISGLLFGYEYAILIPPSALLGGVTNVLTLKVQASSHQP